MSDMASERSRQRLDAGVTELGQLDPVLARVYQEMIENLDFEGELTTARAIILKRGLDTILLKDDQIDPA
jgi:hypothetical protein